MRDWYWSCHLSLGKKINQHTSFKCHIFSFKFTFKFKTLQSHHDNIWPVSDGLSSHKLHLRVSEATDHKINDCAIIITAYLPLPSTTTFSNLNLNRHWIVSSKYTKNPLTPLFEPRRVFNHPRLTVVGEHKPHWLWVSSWIWKLLIERADVIYTLMGFVQKWQLTDASK